jgi:hypothetical protein
MKRKNFDFQAFKKQAVNHLKNRNTLWGEDGVLSIRTKPAYG